MARLDRAAVIEAAKELIDTEGLDALTTIRLAERLGVAQPSLYRHMRDRGELLDELALDANRGLLERVQKAVFARSGHEALAEVAWAWRKFAHDHPGQYAVASRQTDRSEQGPKRDLAVAFRRIVESCGVPESDSIHLGRIVRSLLHGFAHLEAGDHFALDADHSRTYSMLVSLLPRTTEGFRPASS